MCLVLGPSDVARIDNALVDKRSILTTKNILSLRTIDDKMAQIGGLSVYPVVGVFKTDRSLR